MLSFGNLAIRTRPSATPSPEKVASVEPVAQEPPSSPSAPSIEDRLMGLSISSHPAVRRAPAPAAATTIGKSVKKTVVATKPKVKKTASAAPMLKKKGKSKVVKKTKKGPTHGKAAYKALMKAKLAARRSLAQRVTVTVDEARLAIMAKEDAAFDKIYHKYMATMDGSAAADAAFTQALDDTLALLWSPLGAEHVEATYVRNDLCIKRSFYANERIDSLKEGIKKNEIMMADYSRQWSDMVNEYRRFGLDVFGKGAFPTDQHAQEAMQKAYNDRMSELHAERDRLTEELRVIMSALGNYIDDEQAAVEEEFETSARNARAMVFNLLL